jgi:hypothetical protein
MYSDMLKDIKQNDGIAELLFFVFGNPSTIHRYKKVHHVKAITTQSDMKKNSVKLLIAMTMIIFIALLLSQDTLAQGGPNIKQPDFEHSLPTPRGNNLLFFLQRNPDANTVIYELNLNADGQLNKANPVKSSWIRYAEDGSTKALSLVEQKFAYGIKCKALENDVYEIRLVAYKSMPLYLKKTESDDRYRIYIKDQGKDFLLKRVFVRVNGGTFWYPKVEYIDLITASSPTGIELLRRINL